MSNIKEGLIAEIDKRVADKILEPTNAELLRKLIINAENDNEAVSIAQLGSNYNRTGLYYDKRLEKMTSDIRYFKKNKALSFHTDDNKPTHKLIIGDNYEALQNLLIQYKGQVDVIYIDPPYGKDSMGEFAQTNYENAITRDNLLSMLYLRLMLAKQLLSENGVIFCSIDDKNQAYVKCLFDEVFGENNFVANMPRKTRGSATTKSEAELQILHDYLLVYWRNKDFGIFAQNLVGEKKYPYEDERGKFYIVPLQDNGPHGTRTARPNLYYPIYKNENGKFLLTRENIGDVEFLPSKHKNDDGRWMWSSRKFSRDNGDLFDKDGKLYIKHYYNEKEDQNKYQKQKTWLDDYQNAKGTKLISEVLSKGLFDNAKPIELIEWCIGLSPYKENTIVLDFFAGSGTTGHSVLEYNRKYAAQRIFVLCQLPEDLDAALGKYPDGNPTIKAQIELCEKYQRPHKLSEITTERLRRIMTGKCYDGTNDFEWLKKNKPYGGNLDVYEIDTVANFETTDGKTPFDVIDETLYGKEKFATLKEKVDWVCGNFANAQKKLED